MKHKVLLLSVTVSITVCSEQHSKVVHISVVMMTGEIKPSLFLRLIYWDLQVAYRRNQINVFERKKKPCTFSLILSRSAVIGIYCLHCLYLYCHSFCIGVLLKLQSDKNLQKGSTMSHWSHLVIHLRGTPSVLAVEVVAAMPDCGDQLRAEQAGIR